MIVTLGLLLLMAVACGAQSAPSTTDAKPAPGQTGQQRPNAYPPTGASAAVEIMQQGQATYGVQVVPVWPPNSANSGIWVSGRGEATAPPDLAILDLGVEATRDTVQQARSDAAAAMDRAVVAVKARRVADRDIQTRYFNIQPLYTSREVTKCPGTPQPAPSSAGGAERLPPAGRCVQYYEQVITGYRVSNQVTVKIRDLDAIGPIVDEVAQAGGDLTRIQGVRFTIENTRVLRDKARAAAVDDAIAKATQFASLTGSRLGKLSYVTETSGDFPRLESFEQAGVAARGADGPPTPILPGELQVVITVQAAFGIE